MKKKKEFFRIRKDRKRKNGANARAYVCIHRQDSPRPFAAFQIRERTTDDREKNPLTVFSSRPLFSFLNITDRVLFSKPVRVSEPTLFCFLNLPANRKARPSRSLTRARACVYVHKPTRRRHPKTAKKDAVALFKPYKAATRHFTGAVDRFYVKHLFVSYKGFYGRGRAWEYAPPYPPKVSEGTAGGPFSTPLYSEYSARRIIIEEKEGVG